MFHYNNQYKLGGLSELLLMICPKCMKFGFFSVVNSFFEGKFVCLSCGFVCSDVYMIKMGDCNEKGKVKDVCEACPTE